MTDTPRTRDELLDIFASNPDGDIMAQDMRDFVVSTSPVAAARFADAGNFTIYDLNASPVKYSPDFAVDPEGWFTDEVDYSDYLPKPVPQGGLMRLPPGWYDAMMYQSWAGISMPSGADYSVALLHAQDPGPLDPIFGGDRYDLFQIPTMNVPPTNAAFKNITGYGTIRIPSKMLDDTPVTTWPVCVAVFANHFGTDLTGSFGSVIVRRIGPA